MAEELLVVLSRNENSGFGFSLLGQPGLPPIIYEIVEDSPAAESGEVNYLIHKTLTNRRTSMFSGVPSR